jgi:hypothetical protein
MPAISSNEPGFIMKLRRFVNANQFPKPDITKKLLPSRLLQLTLPFFMVSLLTLYRD